MTELLLTLNLIALNAVIIHSVFKKREKKEYKIPKISFNPKKSGKITEEEKRDAEILESIANYNGIKITKRKEKIWN